MALNLLVQNPLLLLFVIAELGYLLGRITIGGSSLGVAVLFVGLVPLPLPGGITIKLGMAGVRWWWP